MKFIKIKLADNVFYIFFILIQDSNTPCIIHQTVLCMALIQNKNWYWQCHNFKEKNLFCNRNDSTAYKHHT